MKMWGDFFPIKMLSQVRLRIKSAKAVFTFPGRKQLIPAILNYNRPTAVTFSSDSCRTKRSRLSDERETTVGRLDFSKEKIVRRLPSVCSSGRWGLF